MLTPRIVVRIVLFAFLLYVAVDCTKVRNCKGRSYGKRTTVDVSKCEGSPCILKKNTTTIVTIKFIPEKKIKQLRTRVFAVVGGIPIPFIGVDGTSACNHLYLKDGSTKADCPLEANNEYVYKDQFDVLPIYPTVNPLVHWALQDSANNQDAACFEVLSKIVQ